MKKIAILTACFGMLGLVMPDTVQAGDLHKVSEKYGEPPMDSNEYARLTNGNYIECDDDDGDAGDGVVLYSVIDETPVAKKCFIEFSGDYWETVDFNECESSSCDGETEDLDNDFVFCSNGVHYRYVGGSYVAGSNGACWYKK